jgi:hypothetical protein
VLQAAGSRSPRSSWQLVTVSHDGQTLVMDAIRCGPPAACSSAINRTTQLSGYRVTPTAVGVF